MRHQAERDHVKRAFTKRSEIFMQPFGARTIARQLTARTTAIISVFLLCTALGFAAGTEPTRQRRRAKSCAP
jgi:hypothetical protein